MASTVLAAGVRLFGDRPAIIEPAKAFLSMVPLWIAMGLVLGAVRRHGGPVGIAAFVLILPLLIVNYLIVITGMEIEEGYLFGLIPLALALLSCIPDPGPGWLIAAAATLDLVYIAKSSMLLVVFALLIACLLRLPKLRHRAAICLLVGLAPLSWGVHQYRASGRFSLGTSVDGMNLHVGNNDQFQNRYPISNAYLDTTDASLNEGHYFTDEWSFNDYHMAAGRHFALSHPSYTLRSIEKKMFVMLVSTNGYTVTPMSRAAALVATMGLVLFRLLLWSSLVLAFVAIASKRRPGRFFGFTYLAFVAAYCAPYIVGFGFTRHAIVLAYPSAIFCALSLRPSASGDPEPQRL